MRPSTEQIGKHPNLQKVWKQIAITTLSTFRKPNKMEKSKADIVKSDPKAHY
jgi:hypothetical protein